MNYLAGVWRSDVLGHLLILKIDPVSVTCIVCIETCSRLDYKTTKNFKEAAEKFVSKHGALHQRISNSIADLVPPTAIT